MGERGYWGKALPAHTHSIHAKMETSMSRFRIKLLGGEVAISRKDARYREERDGEVLALMIAGHCFSWWSNEQLRRRAARKERAKSEQQEQWARAAQAGTASSAPSAVTPVGRPPLPAIIGDQFDRNEP